MSILLLIVLMHVNRVIMSFAYRVYIYSNIHVPDERLRRKFSTGLL